MKNLNLKTLKFFIGLLAGIFIATAGVAFATWQAHWWGTDWIQSGEIISARKVAENFEYLYNRIPNCPVGKKIISDGNGGFTCENHTYSWDVGEWGNCVANNGGYAKQRPVVCKNEEGAIVSDTKCPETKPSTQQECTEHTFKSNYFGTRACRDSGASASRDTKGKIMYKQHHILCVHGTCLGTDEKTAVASYLNTNIANIAFAHCHEQNKHNNGPIQSFDYDDLRDHCGGDFIYYAECTYISNN